MAERVEFNDLPDRNWSQIAQDRFDAGRDDLRQMIKALRDRDPNFADRTTENATDRVRGLLFPNYDGPATLSEQAWRAETDERTPNETPSTSGPAASGTFDGEAEVGSEAAKAKLQEVLSGPQVAGAVAASRALDAVNIIAGGFDAVDAREGLGVNI